MANKELFKGESWRKGYQTGIAEENLRWEKALTKTLREYANTPLSKRENGWEWLLKLKANLE